VKAGFYQLDNAHPNGKISAILTNSALAAQLSKQLLAFGSINYADPRQEEF
jgi:hypothetical protein